MAKYSMIGRRFGANNFDPFVPEWWANETLAILN